MSGWQRGYLNWNWLGWPMSIPGKEKGEKREMMAYGSTEESIINLTGGTGDRSGSRILSRNFEILNFKIQKLAHNLKSLGIRQ